MKTKTSPIGSDWNDFEKDIFSPEELSASNLRVALIGEFIEAKKTKGISQKQLEKLSGVKQPIIARIEKGTTKVQLDTLLKILESLGKTLAIVPIKD